MIKGFDKEMTNVPETIRQQLPSAKSADSVALQKRLDQQLNCKVIKITDPKFKEILKKLPKGSLENSALKDLANLKRVKPKAGVLGKIANFLKHVIK